MRTRRTVLALLGAGAVLATARPSEAQVIGADLNVAPKRIVFNEQTRSALVYVFNRGNAEATYNLELIDRIMMPDGQITAVDAVKPGTPEAAVAATLLSARELITFTPRRVTLQPGESQIVRLRVLRPSSLADGEYRSHLTVTAVPPESAGLTAEEAAGQSQGQIATRINTLFAISIPIIVRQGPDDARAGLENIALAAPAASAGSLAKPAEISVDVTRLGRNSLFGDVEVRDAAAPQTAEPLGVLRGIGVYGEIPRRQVRIALAHAPASGQHLQVLFKDQDIKSGQTLASISYLVP